MQFALPVNNFSEKKPVIGHVCFHFIPGDILLLVNYQSASPLWSTWFLDSGYSNSGRIQRFKGKTLTDQSTCTKISTNRMSCVKLSNTIKTNNRRTCIWLNEICYCCCRNIISFHRYIVFCTRCFHCVQAFGQFVFIEYNFCSVILHF